MSKIHIALVSKEVLPVYYTVKTYNPDIVYLIGTEETKVFQERLKKVFKKEGITCFQTSTKPYDRSCKDTCERIHAQGKPEDEYVYNITGGTKPMAIAAFICAAKYKAKVVYTDSKACINMMTFEETPLECHIDIETIFALQGQNLKEATPYKYDHSRTQCAEKIRDFIANYQNAYRPLKAYYDKFTQLPNSHEEKNLRYTRNNKIIDIEYNYSTVFHSDYPDSFSMLFKGRWWETLVADAVNKWAEGKYAVWTNVEFTLASSNSNELSKNEIDILVNMGNTLLFIECKSGDFDQNNIYKLASICKTYGSYKSKGVIVSFYNNNRRDLQEKAKEENIKIIKPNHDFKDFASQLDNIIISLKA